MLKRKGSFDEAGGTCGSLGVADLGLYRPQCDSRPVTGEHRLETGEFGDVAGLGRGAVRFDQFDGGRLVADTFVGAAQSLGLAFSARRIDAGRAPVRGGAEAPDDCVNSIPVTFGIVETLERQHADTLADDRPVGAGREWPAVTGRREGRRLREAHVHHDVVERIDAAGEDQVGLVQVKSVQRSLKGRQRTRAGGIDDEVGAAEIEAVGGASGDDVAQQAGEGCFLPDRVVVGDIATDLVRFVFRQAVFQHGLAPDRTLHPRTHLYDEFGGGSYPEDDVHPVEVDLDT